MAQTTYDPFPQSALEANRAGRLTDEQRRGFGGLERGIRKERVMFAGVLAVIAILLLTATGPAPNAAYRPLAGAAFAAGALVFAFGGLLFTDSLTRDLGGGLVQTIEGPIGKRSYSTESHSSSSTTYYLEVADRKFEVARLTYEAAPDAGWVRLYFLPRSHKVVNLERLPDKAMPAGALQSPGAPAQILSSFVAAMRSHDQSRINEMRAEMNVMENAVNADRVRAAVPPPTAARDPRPLAEAILGSWQSALVSMTFMPDGTMVATLPGGNQRQGRWSIGPDGKLHSNAMGADQAAEAWVAGDTLTISDAGTGLALHRAQ
jgi:hypothetical protein